MYSKLIFKIILGGVLFAHFVIITFHLLSDNPLSHQYKKEITIYTQPFFRQSWNLFAPNPINTNPKIYYQFAFHKGDKIDSTAWMDIIQPLINTKRSGVWSSAQRVLKSLSTVSLDMSKSITKINKYINQKYMTDTTAIDSNAISQIKKDLMTKTPSHRLVIHYANYTLDKFYQKDLQSITEGQDSIMIRYKIVFEKFPRFSQRHLDYYDRSNYKFNSFTSGVYKLR